MEVLNMTKKTPKKKTAANSGRAAGIAAGSYIVGMLSVVFQPVAWLAGLLFGLFQVIALCGAVACLVHYLVTRVVK